MDDYVDEINSRMKIKLTTFYIFNHIFINYCFLF